MLSKKIPQSPSISPSRCLNLVRLHIADLVDCFDGILWYWYSYVGNKRRRQHHKATNPLYRTSNGVQKLLKFQAQWEPNTIHWGNETFSYHDLKHNDVVLYLWWKDKWEIQLIQMNSTGEIIVRWPNKWTYTLKNQEITLWKNEAIVISNQVLDMILEDNTTFWIEGFAAVLQKQYLEKTELFLWTIVWKLYQSIQSEDAENGEIHYDDLWDGVYIIHHTEKWLVISVIKEYREWQSFYEDPMTYQFVGKNSDLPLDWWRDWLTFATE